MGTFRDALDQGIFAGDARGGGGKIQVGGEITTGRHGKKFAIKFPFP